jgi:hypothetical protein
MAYIGVRVLENPRVRAINASRSSIQNFAFACCKPTKRSYFTDPDTDVLFALDFYQRRLSGLGRPPRVRSPVLSHLQGNLNHVLTQSHQIILQVCTKHLCLAQADVKSINVSPTWVLTQYGNTSVVSASSSTAESWKLHQISVPQLGQPEI